jgi:hypothetical protein
MMTAQQKQIEEIKRDLFSGDDATVLKALLKTREMGNAALVEPLLSLYLTSGSSVIREEAADMLNTLKVSGTEEVFANALLQPQWSGRRGEIVAFMWNSGVQPVEYFDVIARTAVEGSFSDALECLTLLENLEEEIPEEQLLESQAIVQQHLNESPENEKTPLLQTFSRLLQVGNAFNHD